MLMYTVQSACLSQLRCNGWKHGVPTTHVASDNTCTLTTLTAIHACVIATCMVGALH